MRLLIIRKIAVIILLSISAAAFGQEHLFSLDSLEQKIDSLKKSGIIFDANMKKPEISFTTSEAIKYLQAKITSLNWKSRYEPLREALNQLVFEASHPTSDSIRNYIQQYPFDSLSIPWNNFYVWKPVRLRIPYISAPSSQPEADSLIQGSDRNEITDSLSVSVPMEEEIPFFDVGLKDTSILLMVDTLVSVKSQYPWFPFTHLHFPYEGDSIKVAVNSIMDYIISRDSSVINITGLGNLVTPVTFNSVNGTMTRYWLKNELDDSVTVWIDTRLRDTIGLYLEHGVSFRRPAGQKVNADPRVELEAIDKSKLLDAGKITTKIKYWKYRTEASFALNQASASNWVKGGENNISTLLDITGYANYSNKDLKITSDNFARIKNGLIWSEANGIRKNVDLLETNSKVNHKAFGKFDFSAILLFKTQMTKGYNYPNDSVPVSRFMNPVILTAGIGLDYKPNKTTSINVSPFSYKGTFVPDTLHIDQTKYGIDKFRKSKNEPGASFMITNEFKPVKTVTITNRLQLFTNYINNPQNIDIDWEMIVVASLNWFTDVRFNTHLIFDDDTKTVLYDNNNKPVTNPDGTQKKTARVQFKELLGLSFVFRF